MTSQQLLEEYIAQWEEPHGSGGGHTRDAWDARAEEWAQSREDPVTQMRVQACVEALNRHHLLDGDREVLDIGCGPCRFVAAFAQTARQVTGTDLSPKMLEYGRVWCLEQGVENVTLVPCDFKELSVAGTGWEKGFDLVFSSMTPAISGYAGIRRMLDLSRGWVCNCTCVLTRRRMEQEMARVLGLDTLRPAWDGKWFQAMANIISLLGYFPEVTYFPVEAENRVELTLAGVEHILARRLGDSMPCRDKVRAVYDVLCAQSEDGVYRDRTRELYGILLWDTSLRVPPTW